MMNINKYIFYNICNKNIDVYEDVMKTFREDFTNIIKDLKQTNECQEIRKLIHKLVGLTSLLNNYNVELTYILKSLLHVPKSCDNFDYYRDFIYMLMEININSFG